MKTTLKNSVYLMVMIGTSFVGCLASEDPYQPGGYGISQWPAGSEITGSQNNLQPVYQSKIFQQQQHDQKRKEELEKEEERKRKEQIKKDGELAAALEIEEHLKHQQENSQLQSQQIQQNLQDNCKDVSSKSTDITNKLLSCTDGSGIFNDTSCNRTNGRCLLYKFFETISEPFSRGAVNTKLTAIRIGNTYEKLYREDNTNSRIIRIELFNRYKKGKMINSDNAGYYGISIGECEDVYVAPEMDKNSRHYTIPINREMLAALCTTAIAYKFGVAKALLAAAGIAMPGILLQLQQQLDLLVFY